jgi:hypothetical protein
MRQLVHRAFEREAARLLARRAHDVAARHVEHHAPAGRAPVWRLIHAAAESGGLLDELIIGRGLLDDVVRERGEPAIARRAQADTLAVERPVRGVGEHLLARLRDLHRPAEPPGGERCEDRMRGDGYLRSEAAADERADHTHILRRDQECLGDGADRGAEALLRRP